MVEHLLIRKVIMKKKLYHQLALVLAILSVILALGLLIWGERGTIFIAIIPVLLAGILEKMSKC
ncbi:hypothetical protein [Ligilactobacillus murinus]|uniref:hypothetical protein n=2 Tax=Ligilactobacillus murinus TaxID=1622 RepID=UPI0013D6FCDE|nr:hypothetical protein [Ligilactobacillus murinus]